MGYPDSVGVSRGLSNGVGVSAGIVGRGVGVSRGDTKVGVGCMPGHDTATPGFADWTCGACPSLHTIHSNCPGSSETVGSCAITGVAVVTIVSAMTTRTLSVFI